MYTYLITSKTERQTMNIKHEYNLVRREWNGREAGPPHVDFNKDGKVNSNEPTLKLEVDKMMNPAHANLLPDGLDKALAKFKRTGKLELSDSDLKKNVKLQYDNRVFGREAQEKSFDEVFTHRNPDGTFDKLKKIKMVMDNQGHGKLTAEIERT